MTLTRTLTQTHKHFPDRANLISVDQARKFGYPLMGECGEVWIPSDASEIQALPMCPQCDAGQVRWYSRRELRATWVYRCYDLKDRLIYVGCSTTPVQRMDAHRLGTWWYPQVARTRMIVFPTREYALEKEQQAIAAENPRWNIRHRDRTKWTIDDYADCYFAMRQNGSDKRAASLASQAKRLFDVDVETRGVQ